MNDRANFYYDPARQGYDTTLWKTLAGVPASTGTAIRFNADTAIGYGDIFKGNFAAKITVPAVPTAGDVRAFGFMQKTLNDYAMFKIDGIVFSCECKSGATTVNQVVTWNAAWTAAEVEFKVVWTGFSAEFLINGVRVAFINDKSETFVATQLGSAVPKVAMSNYISNLNADNMDVSSVQNQNIQGYL